MNIDDLFDGITKTINYFTDEIAEQQLPEKMLETERVPENGGRNSGNIEPEDKRDMTDFPAMIIVPATSIYFFIPAGVETQCIASLQGEGRYKHGRNDDHGRFPADGVVGPIAPTC